MPESEEFLARDAVDGDGGREAAAHGRQAILRLVRADRVGPDRRGRGPGAD